MAILLLIDILFPPLGRAREPANRVKCESNLRQIGQGIESYCKENGGHLPDSLTSLFRAQDLSASTYVCPSSMDEPATGPTTQVVLSDMSKPGHVSYLYVGNGLMQSQLDGDTVIAYEPLSNHANAGMNVLFGNGTAVWVQGPGVQTLLNQVSSGKRPVKLAEKDR